MKTLGLTAILILLGTFTLATADVVVDEQIAAIAAATPEERVILVNDFKETLSTMNDEERAAAIDQMRATMAETGEQVQTHTQTRQRSRLGQMQQNEDAQMSQQMSQLQTGSQAMQQGSLNSETAAGIPNRFMGNK